uniref:hypothetical protein n=1 Tax=Nocardia sp. 107 TaxID=373212 RepID=UPI001867D059|nr:hypothetical protein [Nocardia sp. 107]
MAEVRSKKFQGGEDVHLWLLISVGEGSARSTWLELSTGPGFWVLPHIPSAGMFANGIGVSSRRGRTGRFAGAVGRANLVGAIPGGSAGELLLAAGVLADLGRDDTDDEVDELDRGIGADAITGVAVGGHVDVDDLVLGSPELVTKGRNEGHVPLQSPIRGPVVLVRASRTRSWACNSRKATPVKVAAWSITNVCGMVVILSVGFPCVLISSF